MINSILGYGPLARLRSFCCHGAPCRLMCCDGIPEKPNADQFHARHSNAVSSTLRNGKSRLCGACLNIANGGVAG